MSLDGIIPGFMNLCMHNCKWEFERCVQGNMHGFSYAGKLEFERSF